MIYSRLVLNMDSVKEKPYCKKVEICQVFSFTSLHILTKILLNIYFKICYKVF